LRKPRIFLLDEPTAGIDVGAKFEIYGILRNLAREGAGILFVSSELNELLGLCHRILVMCQGRVTGEFSAEEADQERIMSRATAFV
jgi:ABC-type sugar transport system ATPase subunit